MRTFFISYTAEDVHFAQTVKNELEQAGFPTWMAPDRLSTNSIWHPEIDQIIKDAFAVLVVLSPNTRTNEFVNYEWAFALGAGVDVVVLQRQSTTAHPRLNLAWKLDFTYATRETWNTLFGILREFMGSEAPPIPVVETKSTASTVHVQDTSAPSRAARQTQSEPLSDVSFASDQTAVHETLTESLQHPMRDVRIQASLMLAQFKEARAVPVLIDALHDRGRDVHQHAAWGLMHIGPPAVPEMIKALKDEDGHVRKDIAKILGHVGDPSAVDAIIEALGDDVADVRRAAAEALGQFKDAAAVPALCIALQDAQEFVRRTAAEALGQIGATDAVHDLIHALHDESESVRVVAAWALGQIKDDTAIPALIETLREKNLQVRQAAAEVLKEIGNQSVETALNEALLDKDTDMRRTAARVLGYIRGRQRLETANTLDDVRNVL